MVRHLILALALVLSLSGFADPQAKPLPLPLIPKAPAEKQPPYFFDHAPFISPKIVQDLCAWESDEGDQVVAINLLEAQGKNRYFGVIQVKASQASGHYPFVCVNGEGDKDLGEQDLFGYQYIGTSSDGVVVLYTSYDGGGSGLFENLLFLVFEKDAGIDFDWKKQTVKKGHPRLLLKKLGELPLGDRWQGDLRVQGNRLFIGEDEGKNFSIAGRPLNVSKEILLDLK
jgi:hypothetical protein